MHRPISRLFLDQSAWNFCSMPKSNFMTTIFSTFLHSEEALTSLRHHHSSEQKFLLWHLCSREKLLHIKRQPLFSALHLCIDNTWCIKHSQNLLQDVSHSTSRETRSRGSAHRRWRLQVFRLRQVGCRPSWDTWTDQSIPICTKIQQHRWDMTFFGGLKIKHDPEYDRLQKTVQLLGVQVPGWTNPLLVQALRFFRLLRLLSSCSDKAHLCGERGTSLPKVDNGRRGWRHSRPFPRLLFYDYLEWSHLD